MRIKFEDFDFDILLDERSNENALICDISYKTLIGAKPLRTRIGKIDGFIRVYDRTRSGLDINYNLTLKNMMSFAKVLDTCMSKSGITYVISHNYARMKVDSCDFCLQCKH